MYGTLGHDDYDAGDHMMSLQLGGARGSHKTHDKASTAICCAMRGLSDGVRVHRANVGLAIERCCTEGVSSIEVDLSSCVRRLLECEVGS